MGQQPREQWGTRAGFLMAAIGSAIGLGNIWRFPYVAYENGGGAFLLPYLIAMLTAGIPLLILEYSIGHRYRSSAPLSYRRIWRPAEALGWWQVAICFVVAIYYAVIIAWSIRYTWFSITQAWGDDPDGFFFNDFLQMNPEPGLVSGYVSGVAWPLIGVWVLALAILIIGVRRGIEIINRITIPLLVVLFAIMVIQALTLDGAITGLDAFFTPDWQAMLTGKVWIAAYGHVFFSLSIGFAIMVTYASYLKRKSDLTGSAMVAGFANASFELLAGIGVFAALGFMATAAGTAVDEVATSGIGLAFVAFPQIISSLPLGGPLFGVLFFACLSIAGVTSLISIVQVIVSAVQDRTGLGRTQTVALVGGATALASILLFPTHEGLHFLDVFDRFINQYGIALAGLVLVIFVSWGVRRLKLFQAHANAVSSIHLGTWWRITLGAITPILLGIMMWDSLRIELTENYEGYPTGFLLAAGWGVAIGAIVFGIIVACFPWKRADAIARDDAARHHSEDEQTPVQLEEPEQVATDPTTDNAHDKEGDR